MADEQVQNQENNIYDEATKNDAMAIESFLENVYAKSVPPPLKPNKKELSFWAIAGLESTIFVMSAIGAAVLSAIRTSGLFFILESLLMIKFNLDVNFGYGLGILAMVSSLLAFEGYLLGYGLVKGRRSGRLEVSNVGMWISMITVIAAGIFSSLSIVTLSETANLIVNGLMAVITGAAAAIVAFYASENFGFIMNHVTAKRNEILKLHGDAYADWRSEGVASYKKSSYNIRSSKSEHVYGKKNNGSQQQAPQENASQPQTKKRPGELVKEYMVNALNNENRLPEPKEIQDAYGLNPSTVYYAYAEFVVSNQQELFKRNYITADAIEKYVLALAKQKKVDPSEYRKDLNV